MRRGRAPAAPALAADAASRELVRLSAGRRRRRAPRVEAAKAKLDLPGLSSSFARNGDLPEQAAAVLGLGQAMVRSLRRHCVPPCCAEGNVPLKRGRPESRQLLTALPAWSHAPRLTSPRAWTTPSCATWA